MPELPEVEHISRWLDPQFTDCEIAGLWVHPGGETQLPQGEAVVRERIRGQTIVHVGRRGKIVLVDLSGGDTLAIHLKMTGQLWPGHVHTPADADRGPGATGSSPDEPPSHTRLSLLCHQGVSLHFVDVRRFGWLQVWRPIERAAWESGLGPEPVPRLPAGWGAGLRGRRAIKAVLLDQSLVAGIGNIYADEILFRAGLHPCRPVLTLSTDERRRLQTSIELEMQAAVAERSGSPDQKRVGGGDRSVKALFHWRVFQRKGEPCGVCRTPIQYATVAQRGTYFCPRCQPLGNVNSAGPCESVGP